MVMSDARDYVKRGEQARLQQLTENASVTTEKNLTGTIIAGAVGILASSTPAVVHYFQANIPSEFVEIVPQGVGFLVGLTTAILAYLAKRSHHVAVTAAEKIEPLGSTGNDLREIQRKP